MLFQFSDMVRFSTAFCVHECVFEVVGSWPSWYMCTWVCPLLFTWNIVVFVECRHVHCVYIYMCTYMYVVLLCDVPLTDKLCSLSICVVNSGMKSIHSFWDSIYLPLMVVSVIRDEIYQGNYTCTVQYGSLCKQEFLLFQMPCLLTFNPWN